MIFSSLSSGSRQLMDLLDQGAPFGDGLLHGPEQDRGVSFDERLRGLLGLGQDRQVAGSADPGLRQPIRLLSPELEQWDCWYTSHVWCQQGRPVLLGDHGVRETVRDEHDVRRRYQESPATRGFIRQPHRRGLRGLGTVSQGTSVARR